MKTVFLAQHRDGTYLADFTSTTVIFFSLEDAEFHLKYYPDFKATEFKLVEVKPTIRITLTSEGTDEVWVKVFDFQKPIYKGTLDKLLYQDIKEVPRKFNVRRDELIKLRAILHHACPIILKSQDIVLGGVLLGHIEYEVIK